MAVMLPFPRTGRQFTPPLPLDLATVESVILARLAEEFGGTIVDGKGAGTSVAVEHFPGRASQEYELKHRVGAVLVRFKGEEYGPVADTEAVIQERTVVWEVEILMRDLGWAYGGQPSGTSPGAYQIIEQVRGSLLGFIVPGFRKMYAENTEYEGVDKQGGVWYFNRLFRHITMAVEREHEPQLPKLLKAQALEQGGQTPVAVPVAPFTFRGSPGTIQLPQINISNVAMFSDDLSTEYLAGTDFSVAVQTGVITRIATGNIAADATVQIGFDYSDVITDVASGGTAPMQPSN